MRLVFIILLLISGNVFSQNYNSDTVYIKLGKQQSICNKVYRSVTLSKDSTEINGFVRWDGTRFYFRDNWGSLYTLFNLKKKNVAEVKYFGAFGSFKVLNKNKNSFNVIPIQPIASHSNILKEIYIIDYSKTNITIKLVYTDGFGLCKQSIITL